MVVHIHNFQVVSRSFVVVVTQALLVMSMVESAQGRNGAFVELVGVLVGDRAEALKEEVAVSGLIVIFLSRGGVRGAAKLQTLLVEVMTVRGLAAVGSPPRVGTGFTTLVRGAVAEGCWTTAAAADSTGLNPEAVGWNMAGTVPLVGAREIMGVVGTGKATLNRGSGSVIPVGKLAGGERLSGDARGGVRGAYGMDTLGMLTTETGVGRDAGAPTLATLT